MSRRFFIPPVGWLWGVLLVLLVAAMPASAQEASDEPAEVEGDEEFLEPEPISPREALYLAIELKDLEAARRALRDGADVDVSVGDPSPLGTAALHNDMNMVRLLISFGGNPGATADSPLEEAIRHENGQMVELFLRSGAEVPHGDRGLELFRLAQRGEQALELSRILLDHSGNPDACLIAAAGHERVDVMRYCLSRGGDVGAMPGSLNILSVALRSGDPDFVAEIVGQGLEDRVFAGALPEAIVAGDVDLVRKGVAGGATLRFSHVESAIENRHPEIAVFLLDQSEPDEPAMLADGDAVALIQQTEDLGYAELASTLRRKSGVSWLSLEKILPWVAMGFLATVLIVLLARNLRRKPSPAAVSPIGTGEWPRSSPRAAAGGQTPEASVPVPAEPSALVTPESSAPAPPEPPRPAQAVPATAALAGERAGTVGVPTPAADGPADSATIGQEAAPAATTPEPDSVYATTVLRADELPLGPQPPSAPAPAAVAPSAAPTAPGSAAPSPTQHPAPAAPASPGMPPVVEVAPVAAPPAPAPIATSTPASVAPPTSAPVQGWQAVPEPVTQATGPIDPVVVAAPAAPAIEVRMPEVDLSRRVDGVFAAARQAASSADEQRSVVLVTPQRVPMLYPCPAPGTVSPEHLASAQQLVPAAVPRNVAVIAFNDLEALNQEIGGAIPFFDLLRNLGYLGHAVWIFEGHVSAMQAGCQEADLLIVDDGMMPYLPGNWRSVASRSMRGTEVHLFERKNGTLRKLG